MNFGQAIDVLTSGGMVYREGWNGKGMFAFQQVPSMVAAEIVEKMTSLPDEVKAEFIKRRDSVNKAETTSFQHLKYRNQFALVSPDNTISGWIPSASDVLADDWKIYQPND
jgi:hypothetical protein